MIGGRDAPPERLADAEQVGRLLAAAGAVVVCGGMDGVMAAVCRGARQEGGLTIGILPGTDRGEANRHVDVAIPTGLGEVRNVLVVRAADAVIAVGGAYGTLSEIAFARTIGIPVVGLHTWSLTPPRAPGGDPPTMVADSPVVADTPGAAVATALVLAGRPEPEPPRRRARDDADADRSGGPVRQGSSEGTAGGTRAAARRRPGAYRQGAPRPGASDG